MKFNHYKEPLPIDPPEQPHLWKVSVEFLVDAKSDWDAECLVNKKLLTSQFVDQVVDYTVVNSVAEEEY